MRLVPLHIYAFPSTFRLKEILPLFTDAEAAVHKEALVAHWSTPTESWALAFDFGVVVFVNTEAQHRLPIVQKLTILDNGDGHAPLTEDFTLEVREESNWEVQFDRVVVPQLSLAVLKIVGLLLAQSTAMDYYNQDMQDISQQLERITQGLQQRGRIPFRIKALLKFIGTCIATKNDILATLSLFDKPEATWEDPALNRLYDALRLELEIQDRYRSLESKLRMIQESLVLLVELSHNRRNVRLEAIVVLLILLEVLLMVWQLYKA